MKYIKNSSKPYIVTAIIALAMFLFTFSSFAEVTRTNNTFKVEQVSSTSKDIQTKYTWEDKDGNVYPIFIGKRGACYIIKVSKKTGKEYKYYLPKDIQETIKKELDYE
jgi:hypothetical protein